MSEGRWLWRNNMFRNLGGTLSSVLIREAVLATKREWVRKYGPLPRERMRTEVEIEAVASSNPGYCYLKAGWVRERVVRGKLYLLEPV